MKQAILSIFCVLYTFALRAQVVFEVNPNSFESTFAVDLSNLNDPQVCYARVKNTSGQKKSLRWAIDVAEAPKGWKFSVCDQNNCYYTFNTTNVNLSDGYPNMPVILMPGDTSRLLLNVFHAGTSGTAEVRLNLYDLSAPSFILNSICYNVTIKEATPLTEAERNRLRIYPNPVSDYMTLTNNNFVKQLWISNILGKRVKIFDTISNGKYDISDLPDGMYLVSMVDGSQKIVKTVRISKRSIRP